MGNVSSLGRCRGDAYSPAPKFQNMVYISCDGITEQRHPVRSYGLGPVAYRIRPNLNSECLYRRCWCRYGGAFLSDERLMPRKIIGVVLGFFGVAVAIGLENFKNFDLRSLAQLAVIGGTVAYAVAGVWARKNLVGMPRNWQLRVC